MNTLFTTGSTYSRDFCSCLWVCLIRRMHKSQTLVTGVGGSLLSIGSAAGVALMTQNKGTYTFFQHLKWSWAIFLGYIGSICFHLFWNAHLFK